MPRMRGFAPKLILLPLQVLLQSVQAHSTLQTVPPAAPSAIFSRWRLSCLPCGKEESIDNPCLPHVLVASGRELPPIAGQDSGVMRQVVIEPEVGALYVHKRKAVANNVVAAEGLLDAEDRLEAPDPTIQTAKGLRAVIGFDPVALHVMSTRELGAQTKGCVLRLPPDVRA